MHAYPHHYAVQATAAPAGDVHVTAAGLPGLVTAPPAEFDGPGDRVDGRTRFTEILVEAVLEVPEGADRDKAARAKERAEQLCRIGNSLVAERRLVATVSCG